MLPEVSIKQIEHCCVKGSTLLTTQKHQAKASAAMMRALQKFLLFHALTCLGRNALGTEIIHGQIAPRNQMLYMASVQTRSGHHCGGSLISDNFVLTAAHCDHHGLESVVLGTHNLRSGGTVRRIVQRCRYPYYQHHTTGGDIMLLKLSPRVPEGGTIRHISLPSPNMKLQHNQVCQVAGWGVTEAGRGVADLRVVDVSVVDQNVCRRQWSGIPANVICAGGYQTLKGACNGDSGGPLVCNGVAAGVVSYGDQGCRDPRFPNVYTDVSKFRRWINQIIRHNGC
ncbi:mast cell protease 1A-like isoform X1 [Acanthopagrus latus]|uniref:mast cell protease 1A-like isoform X1 n=1 Tax=Acanthopagrus latus TaxID=8177 RepID=UPI00187BD5B2|nr:mast cell protease 1A-like isoform X1 [Acanthopagrus latus]